MQKLISQLKSSYPDIQFKAGESFSWSPSQNTVLYVDDATAANEQGLLLHEVAHAILGHKNYRRDVELPHIEQQAWDHAKKLAKEFGISIDQVDIENHLDTYREWLHQRSLCPSCSSIGYQIRKSAYSCPSCGQEWRVNDAKTCQLRRYKLGART